MSMFVAHFDDAVCAAACHARDVQASMRSLSGGAPLGRRPVPPRSHGPVPHYILPIAKAMFMNLQLDVRASPPSVLNGSAG